MLGIVQLHSHLGQFVIFWGPFLFFGASLVIAELVFGVSPLPRAAGLRAGPSWTRSPFLWSGVALISVGCFVGHAPALSVVIPLLVGALALVLRYLAGGEALAARSYYREERNQRDVKSMRPAGSDGAPAEVAGGAIPAIGAQEHVYALVLLFVAMLLLFGTELVFIQDSFNDRMNTVFKLYYQAWEMLAIVGAYVLYYLGSEAFRCVSFRSVSPVVNAMRAPGERRAGMASGRHVPPRAVSAVWLGVAAVFLAAAFVYVPSAIESRAQGFGGIPTLDGLAYYARFQPDDAAAIEWLNQHVSGTPTIVEATGGSYGPNGEVAWMTGLPTLLGWNFHEVQWRGPSIVSEENQRKADLDTIYRSTDQSLTLAILKKYGATYVYVGPLEQEAYPNDSAGLDKFRLFMDVVHQNPGVTIYRARGTS